MEFLRSGQFHSSVWPGAVLVVNENFSQRRVTLARGFAVLIFNSKQLLLKSKHVYYTDASPSPADGVKSPTGHTEDFVVFLYIFPELLLKQHYDATELKTLTTSGHPGHTHCRVSRAPLNTFLGSCRHYFLYRKTTVVHYPVSAAGLYHAKVLCIMIYCQHV